MIKQVGGHKIYIYFLLSIFLLFSNKVSSSQIYDYQTDKFIEKLNTKILSVNKYNKKINFKIINDNFPNAYINENETLFISSGLIIHSPDYVAFLAVLAHEIGHLEKYHIAKRKEEINELTKINSLGNLATIAGSMIMQQPELISVVPFKQMTINNLYINFSQDQEIEADLYAVDTLNKLNLPTDSVKKLLLILENKSKLLFIDEELRKFSTHPLFKTRYNIINSKKKITTNNLNTKLQKEYSFIQTKFIAYTNSEFSKKLQKDQQTYYEAIQNSINGNLVKSLKNINILISKYKNDNYYYYYFIETKADILLSYGYNKEAIEFYEKILNYYPQNKYAKYNIFINLNFKNLDSKFIKKTFLKNLNLIKIFPNNKDIISKYYLMAKKLKYKQWIEFCEILLFKNDNQMINLIKLEKNTKDNNLKKLIKLYI